MFLGLLPQDAFDLDEQVEELGAKIGRYKTVIRKLNPWRDWVRLKILINEHNWLVRSYRQKRAELNQIIHEQWWAD